MFKYQYQRPVSFLQQSTTSLRLRDMPNQCPDICIRSRAPVFASGSLFDRWSAFLRVGLHKQGPTRILALGIMSVASKRRRAPSWILSSEPASAPFHSKCREPDRFVKRAKKFQSDRRCGSMGTTADPKRPDHRRPWKMAKTDSQSHPQCDPEPSLKHSR